MLPLLILTVPPATIGGFYCMWASGQHIVLQQKKLQHKVPPQSGLAAYGAGVATVAGTYFGLQAALFPPEASSEPVDSHSSSAEPKGSGLTKQQGATKSGCAKDFVPPHKQQQAQAFHPPQSMGEFAQRMGRPLLMRMGVGGVAFFCAGVVQTCVAAAWSS